MRSRWASSLIWGALIVTDIFAHARSYTRLPLQRVLQLDDLDIQAPSQKVHALSHYSIALRLGAAREQIRLKLEPSHGIIAEGATIQYLRKDGTVATSHGIDRLEHRIFKGGAWILGHDGNWTNAGWARVNLLRDGPDPLFEGAFSVWNNVHHVQLSSSYRQTRLQMDPEIEDGEYMILWRDSDVTEYPSHLELKRDEDGLICNAHNLDFNQNPQHPVYQALTSAQPRAGNWGSVQLSSLFGKRQQIDNNGVPSSGNGGVSNLKASIGNTQGCPTTRKVALIGVVTDCSYTASFSSNATDPARQNVINQINLASEVYERTLNITLGLQNLTVSPADCPATPPAATPWNLPCGSNKTITDRLNTFSKWRGQFQDTNAYWTLLTNCNTGAEVGLSWLGQLCVNTVTSGDSEEVSGANVVARTSTEWQVIAHEAGHTFGAVHDCDSQTCSDGTTENAQQCCPKSTSTCDASGAYIMNPSTGSGITDFSPCTVGNICSALLRNSVKQSCLTDNKDVTTVTEHRCGNGIVEQGEECDCGGVESCGSNQCCDPTTCKFINNAVCDDSNEECCSSCQFATNGTVCRDSTGVCDPAETCTGRSASCPADVTAPNGQVCGNGLECASGQCTSRDLQCKTLMGSYTTGNDTYACNSDDCTISCASPEFPANECYTMQQNFLDGTPCGGGGSCSNGVCQGSTVGNEISSWIDTHEGVVIGVASAVGGLLLISIVACVVRRYRRRRPSARSKPAVATVAAPLPPPFMHQQQRWPPPPPPPPPQQGYGRGGQSVRYA